MGGNLLPKAGPGALIISATAITGVTSSAAIDIEGGVFGLEGSPNLQGSEANILTVRTGTSFDLCQSVNPLRWSLVLEDQAHLTARNNTVSTHNSVTGPVTLSGNAVLDGFCHDTLAGVLSGPGVSSNPPASLT